MEKQFCNYETAIMLKGLKMREECSAYFDYSGEFHFDAPADPYLRFDNGQITSCYLYSQVEEWLWKKYNILFSITPYRNNSYKVSVLKGDEILGQSIFSNPIEAKQEGIKLTVDYFYKQLKQEA